MKKLLLGAVALLLLIALSLFGLVYLASDYEIPTGETGPTAEALRDRIEEATNIAGFRDLGAVEFTFGPSGNHHFYDIQRRFAEVRMGDTTVRFSLRDFKSRVERDGSVVTGAEAAEALRDAYKFHINDVFWLNPFAQLRSPGIELQKIGEQALLVTYSSGGVTPGDSYLIVTNAAGRPTHWKMWTFVPVKGMEFSFEGWENFGDDVPLSLKHESFLAGIEIENVKVYEEYPAPGGTDRFAALAGR